MERLYRLAALMKKELIQLLKNPKTRITLFLPPVMQLVVLGYAATMDLKEADFAVLDHSRSAASRELIAKFTGGGVFIRKPDFSSENDLNLRLSNRDVKMALVIPANFERALAGNDQPEIQIIVDGRNSSSAGLMLGYAVNIIELFERARHPGKTAFEIRTRAWFNPNYSAQYFMVPALLATIALLDLMLLTALSMAREREDGTFDQLMLTPYSPGELIAIKGAAAMFVGYCQLTFGLLVILYWFQIPFMSSFALLYALFFAFMAASIGIGLLISVLSKDLNQAMLGSFLVAIPFAMLSGLATPVESMPVILQKVTVVNPIRYGVKALQQMFLEGATFAELMPTFAILLAIGVVTCSASYLVFQYQRKS